MPHPSKKRRTAQEINAMSITTDKINARTITPDTIPASKITLSPAYVANLKKQYPGLEKKEK